MSNFIVKFSNHLLELVNNPETSPSMQRMFAMLDQATGVNPALMSFSFNAPGSSQSQSQNQHQNQVKPSPGVNTVNLEEMASKLPKGLRVEDLKPPPAKRSKNKSGNGNASSPITIQTPEARTPKTPGGMDSPGIGGSSASATKRQGLAQAQAQGQGQNAKRKRQSSVAIKSGAKEYKPDMSSGTGTGSSNMTGNVNANGNLLGMNLASDANFINQLSANNLAEENRPFFDAQSAMSRGDVDDPWSVLTSAMEDWQAARLGNSASRGSISGNGTGGRAAGLTEALGLFPPNNSNMLNNQPNPSTNLALSNLAMSMSMSMPMPMTMSGPNTNTNSVSVSVVDPMMDDNTYQDVFDQFMDFSDVGLSSTNPAIAGSSSVGKEFFLYPTPELLGDTDADENDHDTSSSLDELSPGVALSKRDGMVQTPVHAQLSGLPGHPSSASPGDKEGTTTATFRNGSGSSPSSGLEGGRRTIVVSSPGSKAFNSCLFWDQEDDTGFGTGMGTFR
jgi:hypothetical protein